jgi:pimeloyl-ACP methyl ester carboxylesterase
MPASMPWNNDLVIWAHGYVEANRTLAIPEEQLCLGGGFCLPDISTALGFAFVTTSYRNNGLVLDGVGDVIEALDYFKSTHGAPRNVYLVGASEGGLVTTLGVEQHPDLFQGGLAACGPIGDFDQQVRSYADFRVLFDYFFPGLLPGSLQGIPDEAITGWDALWNDALRPAIFAPEAASKLQQLLRTARSSYMANDPATIELTVHDALWYNVFATNDLIARLGGLPYDNTATHYMGSADDAALNAGVARIAGDADAFAVIDSRLQTTGQLAAPLVTLHTWMDQQVAYRQEILYSMKVRDAGTSSQRVLYPVLRYGHCNFRPFEALVSFAILVARVMGAPPAGAERLLPDAAERQAYLQALAARGYATPGSGSVSTSPGTAPRRLTGATD